MRTHKPIGRWPHVPLRTFQRRVKAGFLITLGLILPLAIAFSFVAASDPPLGNGGTPLDHWREALEVAALVALIAWVFFIILFGIARWIMTGEAPREWPMGGALVERGLVRILQSAGSRRRQSGEGGGAPVAAPVRVDHSESDVQDGEVRSRNR